MPWQDNHTTNFPDKEYLQRLIDHLEKKIGQYDTPLSRLMMLSGAAVNWIADYITDENVEWTKESLKLNDLYLTGTGPDWNTIIIDRCKRSPIELRKLLKSDESVRDLFAKAEFEDIPILVRVTDDKFKVLDGMHRVIAAIRDRLDTIEAYVGRHNGKPKPQCEPHVIYDLIKAYHRGINTDRDGLITALRFLRKSYGNVDDLLRERFNAQWVHNDEIQAIIQEALIDE